MSWNNHLSRRPLPARAQATYLKRDGPPHCFYPVLLRMGFTCALSVTSRGGSLLHCLSTLTRYGNLSGLFLLHWPWSHLHRTLSGILPYEARTFLVCCFRFSRDCLSYLTQYQNCTMIFLKVSPSSTIKCISHPLPKWQVQITPSHSEDVRRVLSPSETTHHALLLHCQKTLPQDLRIL